MQLGKQFNRHIMYVKLELSITVRCLLSPRCTQKHTLIMVKLLQNAVLKLIANALPYSGTPTHGNCGIYEMEVVRCMVKQAVNHSLPVATYNTKTLTYSSLTP